MITDPTTIAAIADAIFAFFLGAVGVAFCAYGVYQRHEIQGSAYIIVILGWTLMAASSYFGMALIDKALPLPFYLIGNAYDSHITEREKCPPILYQEGCR